MADIFLRHPRQHCPFVMIDGYFRRLESMGAARLHLNKTQLLAVPSNQIDVPAQFWTVPAPRHNRVP